MLAGRLCRAGAKLHDTIIDSMEMDSGGHLRWNLWLALPPSACCNTGLPGVNYIGGSRQLRRRVGAPNPLPWQGVGPRCLWGTVGE